MNDAQVSDGSPAPASVQAYEEGWYRSLRALAERRRGEVERFDDPEDEAAQGDAAGATAPSLLSRDPIERREALLALADRDPSDDELLATASLMLDPDAAVRTLAFTTLARFPDRLDGATIRRALHDPADDVRALAVRVAASRGPRDAATLMPLVGARRWPETQRAVLEVLPTVLMLAEPAPEDLGPLLWAVADLDPPPQDWERQAFAEIADAIGTPALIEAMTLPDVRRLGAVRLLSEVRSGSVREALAGRVADPLEEIRETGTAAALDLERAAARPEPEPEPAAEAEPAEALDVFSLAGRAPAHALVDGAGSALSETPRDDVVAWAREVLASPESDAVVLVAEAAVVLGLHEIGSELLERTAALSAEHRLAVVEALAEFPDPDQLAGSLPDVAAEVRPEAVRVVWQAAGVRVAPRLRPLLADPSAEVRVAVADVLGRSEDPRSVEAVARLLRTDASPQVRSAAVRSMANAGAGVDDLARGLNDVDAGVRATTVEHLPGDPPDRVGSILAEALVDGDEAVRDAAMRRLAGASSSERELAWSALERCRVEERPALLEALIRNERELIVDVALEHLSSADEGERVLALETVGRGGTQACVQAAIRALGDDEPAVRRAAAGALGRLGDRTAVAALGDALGDGDPDVRSAAVRALGMIDDEEVLSHLVAAMNDGEQSVRETASQVLTGWSSPTVAKRLAGVLTVPSLRESAADLLRQIAPTSVELLIDVLRQGTAGLRETVGPLLSSLVGVDEFIQRMGSLEPERRLAAAEALGAIGGPDAVDALVVALSDADEGVRLRVVHLLRDLGDLRTADAVARLLDDPAPQVVAAARDALETGLDRRAGDRDRG